MLESLPGFDRWLTTQPEEYHLPGCPFGDDAEVEPSEDAECCCEKISKANAESAEEDKSMENYYEKKYGKGEK